jgi:hypothetical protein
VEHRYFTINELPSLAGAVAPPQALLTDLAGQVGKPASSDAPRTPFAGLRSFGAEPVRRRRDDEEVDRCQKDSLTQLQG